MNEQRHMMFSHKGDIHSFDNGKVVYLTVSEPVVTGLIGNPGEPRVVSIILWDDGEVTYIDNELIGDYRDKKL